MKRVIILFISLLLYLPASAQEVEEKLHETIDIIVTTNTITIGTDFSGTEIFIAGTIENIDQLARVQNQYNVIVVLEGPVQPMTIRKKSRRLGMWINDESITFERVPQYYALASTRELRDITNPRTYEQMHLGIDNIFMAPQGKDASTNTLFRYAMIHEKQVQKLYSENIGAVNFAKPSLFTSHYYLPANVPVGQYTVRAYLFKTGKFQADSSTELEIVKDHLAYFIFNEATKHGFWYGIIAVIIAIITGLTGRIIFRKD